MIPHSSPPLPDSRPSQKRPPHSNRLSTPRTPSDLSTASPRNNPHQPARSRFSGLFVALALALRSRSNLLLKLVGLRL
ncbi:hypothetical protein BJX70DRAFT_175981 [Aspergillus crustosus]